MASHTLLRSQLDVREDAELREKKQAIANVLQNTSELYMHSLAAGEVGIV